MTAPVIDEAASNSDILHEKVQEIKILNKYQKNQLQAVLEKNREVFSQRLGQCKTYVHHFEVNDLTPYEYRSRPIPSSMIEDVNKTIQKMLEDNVIEPADSSYINPLCIVRKPSGEVHITIDARKMKARSRMNYFRNENVESLLNKVNGAKYLTIADLSASFWQIGLQEPCKGFTAFLHNGKQYRFTRTPFGLNSSNSALLRALHGIFKNEVETFAACFTDDICIFDNCYNDHLKHIDFVLSKLREAGFTLKPEKTHFVKSEVEFLGFIISEKGIRPNRKKIDAILQIPAPKNIRQLRRFLGVCQYQARFLISYAKEVAPRRALLRKGTKWPWSTVEKEAFEKTRRLFADSVLLQCPDYSLPFVLFTDASLVALGAVLVQETEENEMRVISTTSRTLTKTEQRMFPTELEICAIYHALQRFREFIFNRKIIVRSDSIS